jgi:hypothetical protein
MLNVQILLFSISVKNIFIKRLYAKMQYNEYRIGITKILFIIFELRKYFGYIVLKRE